MSTSRSRSRSRRRPQHTRNLTSESYLSAQTPPAASAPEGILVGGPVDAQAVNLISSLRPPELPGTLSRKASSTRYRTGNEVFDDDDRWTGNGVFAEEDEDDGIEVIPWWKTPSPIWMLVGTFISAIAIGMTIAPRIEVYTRLVCREIRPEYDISPFISSTMGSIPRAHTVIPRPSSQCQEDKLVQQTVAKLGATIVTITGMLSCLTAAHWGQFSDRKGRTMVLGITMIGGVFTESTLILVSYWAEKLPFGYKTLLIAPVIEGLCGGMSAGSAATHAYISDATTPLSRSRTLAMSVGLFFTGMAIGPTIGGLLITYTNNLLTVFYITWTLHVVYTLGVLFIFPESLSKEDMRLMRERGEKEKADRDRAGGREEWWRFLTKFLRPLNILAPRKRIVAGGLKKDWNLTLLTIAYGAVILVMGSYPFKFQYASLTFGWTSEELGYWLSFAGVARASFLILVLPAIIKLLITYTSLGPPAPSTPTSSSSTASREKHHQTSRLDLTIARGSLLLELTAYSLIFFWPTNDVRIFTGAALLSSFGGGFSPSVQALALEIVRVWDEEDDDLDVEEERDEAAAEQVNEQTPLIASTSTNRKSSPSRSRSSSPTLGSITGIINTTDTTTAATSTNANTTTTNAKTPSNRTGTIFGALSVVQALCSQIIGPALYSYIFVKGLDFDIPRAIFGVSGLFVIIGIGCLAGIRVGGVHAPRRAVEV